MLSATKGYIHKFSFWWFKSSNQRKVRRRRSEEKVCNIQQADSSFIHHFSCIITSCSLCFYSVPKPIHVLHNTKHGQLKYYATENEWKKLIVDSYWHKTEISCTRIFLNAMNLDLATAADDGLENRGKPTGFNKTVVYLRMR